MLSLLLGPQPNMRPPASAYDAHAGLARAGTPSTDRTRIGTLDVPWLGVGTIAWTDKLDRDPILNAALDEGLDLFDTAERYGAKATNLIPAALAAIGLPVGSDYLGGDTESYLGAQSKDATIITKFAPTPWRGDAKSVVDACRDSAKRLDRESVDLMQVHMPDIIQPFRAFGYENRREEAHWDGLAECYHSGLAKNVGVSNYGPTLLERAHHHLAKRDVPLASNQIHFNLLYRRQGSLAAIDKAKDLGVQTLAYYPLAMGLLTGKLTSSSLKEKIARNPNDTRSRELLRYLVGGKGGGFPNTAGDIPDGGIQPLLFVLHEIASRIGKTPAQVALNYIICKGVIPLPGASTVSQVKDNRGALGWRLSHEDVALLDAAADSLPFEFRGCGFQTADSKFVGYGFETWRLD
ncbi:hypothetical protein AB1Y20_003174 [Prymnesium parvum]|uniref:NADP-dependent oxidoreductase domain-containing protein n=1 Tax=Prymnesium parvum TaxID=97485 RepID=A0AB34JBA8_PRYPA